MRFDIRDKKPTLFNILFLSLVVAAAVAVLLVLGAERHARVIALILDLYLLLSVILLLHAFREQVHYNPYSYNTIYYMGFALFLLSVLITQIRLTILMIREPSVYEAHQILYILFSSAKHFMLISFPFILLFSLALCISNISLIRHEGRRFVNLLGIILSILLVAGEVFLFRYDYYATGSMMQVMLHDLFGNLFAAIYLYFECMLLGAIVAHAITSRHEPLKNKAPLTGGRLKRRESGSSLSPPAEKGRMSRSRRAPP